MLLVEVLVARLDILEQKLMEVETANHHMVELFFYEVCHFLTHQ